MEWDGENKPPISENQKLNIFREGTGRPNQLEWLKEIHFCAQAIFGAVAPHQERDMTRTRTDSPDGLRVRTTIIPSPRTKSKRSPDERSDIRVLSAILVPHIAALMRATRCKPPSITDRASPSSAIRWPGDVTMRYGAAATVTRGPCAVSGIVCSMPCAPRTSGRRPITPITKPRR